MNLSNWSEDETIDIEDVAGGDLVFGSDEVIETVDEPPEYFTGPGITQVLSMEESDVVLASEKVIAYEKQLLLLAKTKIDERCLVKGCPELVEISTKYVASALYIIWVSLTSVIIKYCIHSYFLSVLFLPFWTYK